MWSSFPSGKKNAHKYETFIHAYTANALIYLVCDIQFRCHCGYRLMSPATLNNRDEKSLQGLPVFGYCCCSLAVLLQAQLIDRLVTVNRLAIVDRLVTVNRPGRYTGIVSKPRY